MNYKITLEYDGSRYNGWQRQHNTDNTIQGKLEDIFSKYFEQDIEVHASGRTDAGVHALGQVANFKIFKQFIPDLFELEQPDFIMCELNRFLPDDIRITSMEIVDARFHARLNAKSKWYRYRLCLSDKKSVFDRKYSATFSDKACDLKQKMNIALMQTASQGFIGEHDFGCFSDTKTKKSTVRTVESINIFTEDSEGCTYLIADFKGNGFLYHTVRLMMGTLIKIGLGECSPSIIEHIFETNDRKLVPCMAPAEGLFLMEVYY